MSAALVAFELWTISGGVVLAGCLLGLRPITVALMTPAAAGLLLAVQAVA